MITIESKGSDIVLFGREGKIPYVKTCKFNPYFYVDSPLGDRYSIEGKKVKKITVDRPGEIPLERTKYFKTYEADVRYTNRYIIDEIKEYNKEEIRICYIDIEIKRTEKGYENCEKANNVILCIGCYDSFNKEYKQFCLNVTHTDEKKMLEDFISYVCEKDPDMFVAWNGDMFDFPFVVNRMIKLGVDEKQLCRESDKLFVTKAMDNVYDVHIYGRLCFDLMRAYKKMNAGGRESWSLDYISRYEKVGEKEKYKGELDDLFKDDINKFLDYNKKDVELMVLLNEKLGIVDFFDEVRRLCYCKIQDVFMNTKIADCLCLKYARGKYVLPDSVRKEEEQRITGGFVKDNIPKLYDNVAVMDMKSLYPSIMIGFNTSYETLLTEKKEDCINMFNTYFYKKEKGIIPAIVQPLLEKRKKVSKERAQALEQFGADSREYKSLDVTQYALKVIANSFYGVLLEPHFRLSKRDVAQSITFAAQTIVKEVHRWFEEKGMEIVYGDTDSCFISMANKSINDMELLNDEINSYFKNYFKPYGIDEQNNIFKLEFEKVFSKVLFKKKSDGKGAKKRYAGRVVWNDGKEVDKLVIVGFESRRSDSPEVGRMFLKEVLRMISYDYSQTDIMKYIDEFKNKIKSEYTPEQIGLPISITKPLEQYGNQIHAKAARLANQRHDAGITMGDKIKYLYVKGECRIIAFKSSRYMWDGYNIDFDKMTRRIVDMKIGPIFESLGWKHNFIVKTTKEKPIEILELEDILTQKELW
jgi:DNA polymerase I